jgi:hypothetical protein
VTRAKVVNILSPAENAANARAEQEVFQMRINDPRLIAMVSSKIATAKPPKNATSFVRQFVAVHSIAGLSIGANI